MGDDGFAQVVEALSGCPTLQELNVEVGSDFYSAARVLAMR
jgi:hypothetical protein